MPLYEYECKKCHHRFEKIQKFSDPHVKKCPNCGGPIEQVISAPAVQFKGSGWYVTDFKGDSSAKPVNGDANKDGAAKPDASAPAGSAAPATKSETAAAPAPAAAPVASPPAPGGK